MVIKLMTWLDFQPGVAVVFYILQLNFRKLRNSVQYLGYLDFGWKNMYKNVEVSVKKVKLMGVFFGS